MSPMTFGKTQSTLYILSLPFLRRCRYGGDDEFYIQVRETGNHQQEKIHTEQEEEIKQENICCLAKLHMTINLEFHIDVDLGKLIDLQSTSQEANATSSLGNVALSRVDGMQQRTKALDSSAVAATSEAGYKHCSYNECNAFASSVNNTSMLIHNLMG